VSRGLNIVIRSSEQCMRVWWHRQPDKPWPGPVDLESVWRGPRCAGGVLGVWKGVAGQARMCIPAWVARAVCPVLQGLDRGEQQRPLPWSPGPRPWQSGQNELGGAARAGGEPHPESGWGCQRRTNRYPGPVLNPLPPRQSLGAGAAGLNGTVGRSKPLAGAAGSHLQTTRQLQLCPIRGRCQS